MNDRVGGSRRAANAARPAGRVVNDKCTRRLRHAKGLRVPQRCRNHRFNGVGLAVGAMGPIQSYVVWAADFKLDVAVDGRRLKLWNIIDEFTREAIAIEVHRHSDADHVDNILDRLATETRRTTRRPAVR